MSKIKLEKFKPDDSFAVFILKLQKVLESIALKDYAEKYADKCATRFFEKYKHRVKKLTLKYYLEFCGYGHMNELPITSEFCKKHKQNGGAYINNAKAKGIINPNQYWHLCNSWPTIIGVENTFVNAFGRLNCPELILGIAEISGINKDKLNDVQEGIRKTYNDYRCCNLDKKKKDWDNAVESSKTEEEVQTFKKIYNDARLHACQIIRQEIPFKDIIDALNESVKKYN